jgi:FkbM family methyltransferase
MLRHRFDVVEVGLIAIFSAVMAAALVTTGRVPAGTIRTYEDLETEAYYAPRFDGTPRHSTHAEEWLIRDFFRDRRDGVFVDVGASHFRDNSNTYFLETSLSWSGLAIDAQVEYAADYVQYRPRTRYITAFVTDQSDQRASLFVPPTGKNRQIASGQGQYTMDSTGLGETRSVPTFTLDDILKREGIKQFELLSLDIELFEPKALAGFDINTHHPALVCVEAHLPIRQQLLDYFARHQYVVVGRYLRTDRINLYFMPVDRSLEPDLPTEVLGHTLPH